MRVIRGQTQGQSPRVGGQQEHKGTDFILKQNVICLPNLLLHITATYLNFLTLVKKLNIRTVLLAADLR